MTTSDIPTELWRSIGVDPVDVIRAKTARFHNGTGAASGEVDLITVELRGRETLRFVRKSFVALRSGPHAESSGSPSHWANWRRELTAYQPGILPEGPGLRAPRLLTIVDGTLYLEYVGEITPNTEQAALDLGRWHHADRTLVQPWLAQDQLAQRLAASELDWASVESDHRLAEIWSRRHAYLDRLDTLPRGITHGDFSAGNLRVDRGGVIALDWATFGISPVGFDLAHLALTSMNERLLPIYLDGLQRRFDADSVSLGYRTAVILIGASRAHWMASRSIPVPTGYGDFIDAHRP